ncbi:DNA-binding response regulator, LytR/AlgR family [Catalinimonas alkaloidigena]|uniref:DNA-binding response regulator, LytR/AlgR family n=1 Tax=Catalinimonas alkaloidigena TaxID=1075417 RepID=A0A1G9AWK2_9BACT|nr:LytTR family DNA-binding domain-containing protein [Catalinimonas alkaloidigena]SDK31691.1 DNA-binding response regulator, LytR/AlgR family [Catalinimonas alkaloidigena]
MKAIALDDEPQALEIIRAFAAKVPFLTLEAAFTNAFSAMDHLRQAPADLLFLDIKMPDISGLDFLRSLPQRPLVIFTTAYSEHAVTSYDLDAVDYLLKPFALSRFLKACHKAEALYQLRHPTATHVFVKSGYEQIRVELDEILYLEGAGNYVVFVLTEHRKIASRLTMQEALELLPTDQFVRIHRSYVVACDKIDRLDRHDVQVGTQVLPIGANFREELLTQVGK